TLDSAASTPTRYSSNGNSRVRFSLTERTLIDCGFRIADCGSLDCGLRTADCGSLDCGLRTADCGFDEFEASIGNVADVKSRSFSPQRRLEPSEARRGSSSSLLPFSPSPALSSAFCNPQSATRNPQSKIGFATSAACEPCARLRKTSTPSSTRSARGGPTGLFSAANPTNQPCVRHLTLEVEVPVLPKT